LWTQFYIGKESYFLFYKFPPLHRKCRRKRGAKSKARARSGSGGEAGYYSSGDSGYDSAGSAGSCRCNNAEVGGGARSSTTHNTSLNARSGSGTGQRVRGPDRAQDMESVLRDGRVQALVEGLWTKVVRSSHFCSNYYLLC